MRSSFWRFLLLLNVSHSDSSTASVNKLEAIREHEVVQLLQRNHIWRGGNSVDVHTGDVVDQLSQIRQRSGDCK